MNQQLDFVGMLRRAETPMRPPKKRKAIERDEEKTCYQVSPTWAEDVCEGRAVAGSVWISHEPYEEKGVIASVLEKRS
jgi:hypothetical protein